jgi:catechol 2,3-dioxygenase-like lactoylglutathione lyase family enzyme
VYWQIQIDFIGGITMNVMGKLFMLNVVVTDMEKAREFYVDKLGCKVTKNVRQDDKNWWVSLEFPGGGPTVTIFLTTYAPTPKPGGMAFYISSPDIQEAYKQLNAKGVKPDGEIMDDLYGPGSKVKWFSIKDPDGNNLTIAQSEPK